MSRHVLRRYQTAAVDAAFDAWRGGMRRPAIVLPTGEGKTTVFTAVIERWLAEARPEQRALVLAHRRELIDQAADRVRTNLPGLGVGVMMAERCDTLPRVIVGSVQTLAGQRRRRMLRNVGLIVVDEAHRAAASSYVSLLEHYGAMGDGAGAAVALGVTATMSRSDEKALGDVWQDVVFRRSIGQAIRGEGNDGIPTLVRPIGIRVVVDDLDLRKVKTSRGDYADGALGQALSDSLAPKRIVEAYREHAADRQGIVFAPTVESARVIMEEFASEGFSARLVHGGTPKGERSAVLDAFRAGSVQVLCNCGVFTEGTDLPMASVAVIARPTKHSGLYIQMVGRVLRLAPGKRDALVLDVAGAAARHSLDARVELFGAEDARAMEAPELDLADVEPVDAEELIIEAGIEGVGDGTGPADYRDGTLRYEIVDLFAGSDTSWQRTGAGIWFFPAGERYLALVPADPGRGGGVDVVSVPRYAMGAPMPVALGVGSLAEAQRIAEAAVAPSEMTTAARGRRWKADKPSEKMLAYAVRLGLQVPAGAHAGEVSEMLTMHEATERIDRRMLPSLPWITYG